MVIVIVTIIYTDNSNTQLIRTKIIGPFDFETNKV
jgi:hypothetical protein